VTAKINGQSKKTTFDNTTGYVVETGYKIAQSSWVNLRYVSEKYQGNTYTSTTGATSSLAGTKAVDGSHFGVNFMFEF
jgi:hypothetical protein